MRADRFTSLRQRLRREADTFEFGALIDGVSTLEEESPARPALPRPSTDRPPELLAPTPDQHADDSQPHSMPDTGTASPENGVDAAIEAPAEIQTSLPLEIVPEPPVPTSDQERVRLALEALGRRLLERAARLRVALRSGDADGAGQRLAELNHIAELLRSVDPDGSLARSLHTVAAPPKGRAWPQPAWSVAEFAESPFSALLPASAGEPFVRAMMYSAWGVTFE